MFELRTVLFLFVMTYILSVQSRDNIFTISPNNSICIGESVVITCYLYPPTANDYAGFALLSFNGSTPEDFNDINTDFGSIGYVATVVIPVMGDSSRIQLNITSFQVSDSNTLFGCHVLLTSNGMFTEALKNGTASLAAPPSSFVVTLSQPNTSCSTILTWSPPVSERPITSYSVYRDSISIADVSSTTTQYTDSDVTGVYTYSVVAISCAGNTTSNTFSSVSIGVPFPPGVTLSLSYNTLISWSTPSSDRSITSYSVYRDGVSIYNGSNTTNQFTDNTQLNINTVYEYSVVAISCAGTSTAGVKSIKIGSTSLDISSPLSISYDNRTNELFVDWTLIPLQPITVTYNLSLVYSYTQFDNNYPYVEKTEPFSQPSYNTNYTQPLKRPAFPSDGLVVFIVTVTLNITHQSGIPFSGRILTATNESTFMGIRGKGLSPCEKAAIAVGVIAILCCCCVPIPTGVIIFCCISKKKGKGYSIFNSKKKSDTHELGPVEEQMYSQIIKENKKSKEKLPVGEKTEGLYADIDHTFPKPETLKRPEPVEETLYTRVQPSVDGPSQ